MKSDKIGRVFQIMLTGTALVFLSGTLTFAAIEFDIDRIETEIVAAIAVGENPVVASKDAVVNAVRTIVADNPEYPGGAATLNAAIFRALGNLKITGLDEVDLFISANHALGITINPELEAYEDPGEEGGENAYGPGGKAKPGSDT